EEKVAALIHRRIPMVDAEKFKFTFQEKTLAIDMPEDTFYLEGVQIAKRGIAIDVQRYLPEIVEIKFVETYKSESKPAAKTETQETKS
ncbi:MAG: peptidylprolyl isomerase, partial [Candidatus Bathyarchaeia archaeon]